MCLICFQKKKKKSKFSASFPIYFQWVWPHLEFQCIERVFGGAAERPLNIDIQWVEQLVALGLQGTAHLQGGWVHRAGAVVDQLRGEEIVVRITSLLFFCFYCMEAVESRCTS